MNIYKSLEQLNISEECFEDIIGIVEEIINEFNNMKAVKQVVDRKNNAILKNTQDLDKAMSNNEFNKDKPSINAKAKVGKVNSEGYKLAGQTNRILKWATKKGRNNLPNNVTRSLDNLYANGQHNSNARHTATDMVSGRNNF